MCPVCECVCSLGDGRCVQHVRGVCSLGDRRCVQHVRGVCSLGDRCSQHVRVYGC